MQTSFARLASTQHKAAAFLALKQWKSATSRLPGAWATSHGLRLSSSPVPVTFDISESGDASSAKKYEVSILKFPTSTPSHHFLTDDRTLQQNFVVSVTCDSETAEIEVPSFDGQTIQFAGESAETVKVAANENAWEITLGSNSPLYMPYPRDFSARQYAIEKVRPAHWGPHGPLSPAEKAAIETANRAEEVLSGVSSGAGGHVAPPGKVVVAYVYADDPNGPGAAAAGGQVVGVKTNMHGKVVKVNAKVGAEVKKGEAVVVLEAMKMETILRAPCDGVVRAVRAKVGETVQQGVIVVTVEQKSE